MSLKVKLIEEKEEVGRHPFAWNILHSADAGTRAVAHRAVALHLADARTGGVANRTVAVELTNSGTAFVPEGTVAVNLTHT